MTAAPHPAQTLANKLHDALDRWPDEFDAVDRDRIAELIYVLERIADRNVKGRRL